MNMKLTTLSLIEELQNYPDLPIILCSDHANFPHPIYRIRKVWALKESLKDNSNWSYLQYDKDLDALLEEVNDYDEDKVHTASDCIEILLIGD